MCYMHAPKLDKAYKLRQNSHIADSVARSKVLTRPRLANYRVKSYTRAPVLAHRSRQLVL